MYKTLIAFRDGQNGKAWPLDKGGHSYVPGDTYPKAGFEPAEEHIAYLLGNGNRFGKPVIEITRPEDGGKDLSKMIKAELIAYAAESGIDIGEAKTVSDIRAAIEDALKE